MRITRVHQIELTNRCNIKCHYCPHSKMVRAKGDMDVHVFRESLKWALKLDCSELSLTGMGEATLHPKFPSMLRLARLMLPSAWLLLSSNGINVSDECMESIAETETTLYISTHRPEKAGLTYAKAKAMGIDVKMNSHFVDSGIDWAGQVEWPNLAPKAPCQYLAQGWVGILQNGDIVNCCMDYEGDYAMGNVTGNIPTTIDRIPLCDTCHLGGCST